jgi:hypothetical protein
VLAVNVTITERSICSVCSYCDNNDSNEEIYRQFQQLLRQ